MILYKQGNEENIRDFIFPIVTVKKDGANTLKITSFLGTGFLIGNRGYALTCSHVIKEYNETIGALFVDNNKWVFLFFDKIEQHLTEDVSIIHINNPDYIWKSPFLIDKNKQYGWLDYLMGGYPNDVVWENIINTDNGYEIQLRPDLISIKGYVRRRYSGDLGIKGIKGSNFYELSTIAGKGCSGSPVFTNTNKIWKVFGIYTAEKVIYKGDLGEQYVSTSASYAIRSESFINWKPKILDDVSIEDESKNYFI